MACNLDADCVSKLDCTRFSYVVRVKDCEFLPLLVLVLWAVHDCICAAADAWCEDLFVSADYDKGVTIHDRWVERVSKEVKDAWHTAVVLVTSRKHPLHLLIYCGYKSLTNLAELIEHKLEPEVCPQKLHVDLDRSKIAAHSALKRTLIRDLMYLRHGVHQCSNKLTAHFVDCLAHLEHTVHQPADHRINELPRVVLALLIVAAE
jgi:hypothetical protein